MHRVWLALLVAAALAMWIGVPAGWLWIGSQVQGATDDLGAAVAVMLLGSILSIAAMAYLLARITSAYQDARVARGLEDTGSFPLEVTLVCTAVLVGGGFIVWFFGFSGGQPFPLFSG